MFYIFGAGKFFSNRKKSIDFTDCLGFIDNDEKKQGLQIEGKTVFPPEQLAKSEFDDVYIFSKQTVEMYKQLVSLGVPKSKIHEYTELCTCNLEKAEVTFYNSSFKAADKHKVLFITNGLALCGAITALLQVCKLFKKRGWEITLLTDTDGAARSLYTNLGVEIIIDTRMRLISLNKLGYEEKYDIFFFNALQIANVISNFSTAKKVFWWLHEPEEYYALNIFYESYINRINLPNLKVYGVGERACEPFRRRSDKIKIESLLYALPDIKVDNNSKHFKIACIGLLSDVKGQDLLLDVFERGNIPDDVELHLIGDNSTFFAQNIIARAEKLNNVVIRGEISQNEITFEYKSINLLICPSRTDCMPTVVAQAMQNEVPVMLSDACGTVNYIHDMKDGVVFRAENTDDLSLKLSWALSHRAELMEIGKNGRKIYEKYFTIDSLDSKIGSMLNG